LKATFIYMSDRLLDGLLEGLFNGVLDNDDIFDGELDGLSCSI